MKKVNIIDIDTYVKQVYNSSGFTFYGDYFTSFISNGLNMEHFSGNLDFLTDLMVENEVNITIGDNTYPINTDERKPFKLKRK